MKKILALAFVLVAANSFAAEATRPNIVFILADDLGIGNVSCYGADNFKTPNIDALARGGIRYTHCYGTPLCGPSRALLLTGRYAFRTGMTGNSSSDYFKSSTEVMIPKVLKAAGYVSGCFGKWGQLPLQPSDFGFDDYLRFSNSGVYWRSQEKNTAYVINGKEKPLPADKYMPDLVHERVIDFIRRHRSEPFFAYYSMSHVHAEMLRTPDSAPDSKDFYRDNITYMDKLVGDVVNELEKLKLREKTLIIFVGDNGTAKLEYERSTIGGKRLSGHKSDMLEGGSLVPMIANWPGTVSAGKLSEGLMDFSDYLPTFAELAGAPLPAGVTIDGESFAAQLRGNENKWRDWIFVELGAHWHVRDANWKLNEAGELFDMKGAPFEERLVAAENETSEAKAERKKLQTILAKLDPASGVKHVGSDSGKHDEAEKQRKKAAKNSGAKPPP